MRMESAKDKTYKTVDEQITLLASRGIDFSTPEHKSIAKKMLQHEGYYNLINGYKKLFLSASFPSEKYRQGTTIEEIYALYKFDRKLRNIFFWFILPVETNVKNIIANTFSQLYGHDNYMLYKNFNTDRKGATENITSVIADFQHQLAARSNDPSISHYLATYGYVPLWVLNNILTLGQVSKFYSIMKQKDRQIVSKVFHIQDNQLESVLLYLSSIRNFCAHGNRLYCFRSKRPLTDFDAHVALNIPKSDGNEYDYGKRDLFAAMIALSYVLSRSEYQRLVKEILNALNSLQRQLSVITKSDVLKEMGFPEDWNTQLFSINAGYLF
jgi:abortive infection bacteriophage resistance protein